MTKLKLTEVAPYSGKRVQPFDGVKKYLSTGNVQDEGLSFKEITYNNKPSRADILVSEGDILFAKMVNTNKVLQIDEMLDNIIVSTGFSVHRPDKKVLAGNYLMHFFKDNSFLRQKNKFSTGAIQSAISNAGIEKIFVPVPSIADQIKISEILNKAETIIEQRKQSIALLDKFMKVTFFEIFGDPISNKKGWELLPIAKIGDSRLGKMLDGKKIIGNNLKPYLRNLNVIWFGFQFDDLLKMDFDEKDKSEFSLNYGDILMCEGGEIGRCAIWKNELKECYFQKAIHRIRLNKEYALPEYFVFMFWQYTLNGGLRRFMNAATISHLTGEKLKKMRLPIPPIELQTKFVNTVKNIEVLKEQYKISFKELGNLYASLSQRAFKGELNLNKINMKTSVIRDDISCESKKITAFYKMQILGAVINKLEENEQQYGEMIIAKFLYLLDRFYKVRTGFSYKQWHFGPYDPEIKKLLNSKQGYFRREKNSYYSLLKKESIFKYSNPDVDKINEHFPDLLGIFNRYPVIAERKDKIELLATVSKVIEDKRTLNFFKVIKGMKDWTTDKKITGYSNKAEKFSEKEITRCIQFIIKNNLFKELITPS